MLLAERFYKIVLEKNIFTNQGGSERIVILRTGNRHIKWSKPQQSGSVEYVLTFEDGAS
jgi:hypothetical protein